MTPLQRITERVCRDGHPDDPDTPIPLLTLDEFFDGNDVVGSIGCNLDDAPAPDRIHGQLAQILARDEVVDIKVQITAFDDPSWPFSDTVYLVTSASPEQVLSWFTPELAPSDAWQSECSDLLMNDIDAGLKVIACWWD